MVMVEGGSLLVRVVDRTGRAQGGSVRLVDELHREFVPVSALNSYGPTVEPLDEVRISSSRFEALPPGRYTIRARTLAGGVSEGSVLVEAGQHKIETIVTD